MPAKPAWLLRVPQIIEEALSLQAPVIDRACCERLFGVRRRRAIDLMQLMGGYQCGRTYLVKRQDLLGWLEQAQAEPGFRFEQQRKQKLTRQLDALHRHRAATKITIAVVPERRPLPEMPTGVVIRPGSLSVSFATAEELLARLYAFSQAIADDFDTFCEMVDVPSGESGHQPPGPDIPA